MVRVCTAAFLHSQGFMGPLPPALQTPSKATSDTPECCSLTALGTEAPKAGGFCPSTKGTRTSPELAPHTHPDQLLPNLTSDLLLFQPKNLGTKDSHQLLTIC